MLNIASFDARIGMGDTRYRALTHPLADAAVRALYARLSEAGGGRVAIYDPTDTAAMLFALHPAPGFEIASVHVQELGQVGQTRLGQTAQPVTALAAADVRAVLVAAFDADRLYWQSLPFMPKGALVLTLDEAALPPAMRTNPRRVLDPMNYATGVALFRDTDAFSTRVLSAEYFSQYGAKPPRLWLRLTGLEGEELAAWEEQLAPGQGVVIDSAEIRARFALPAFEGQLFLHAIGAEGHTVVKFVEVLRSHDGRGTLSCDHDANPWPADRYAGIPAPRPGERVLLWIENPHPIPIPVDGMGIQRMGGNDAPVVLPEPVPARGVRAFDIGAMFPGLEWPAQVELIAERRTTRPRYELLHGDRRVFAHANVERMDLKPDPAIPAIVQSGALGRGWLLPFAVFDPATHRNIVLPTPMSGSERETPLRLEVFDREGRQVAERYLGRLPRNHATAVSLADLPGVEVLTGTGGHAELVYDFREPSEADGWLHGLFRWEHAATGHIAESSFGGHVFNTIMTHRGEPQSYMGPAPGLSTKLFLPMGGPGAECYAVLINPASVPGWASETVLELHRGAGGGMVAKETIAIPSGGSRLIRPHRIFAADALQDAGKGAYVLIRDRGRRLFGYAGVEAPDGRFGCDHMFGF